MSVIGRCGVCQSMLFSTWLFVIQEFMLKHAVTVVLCCVQIEKELSKVHETLPLFTKL